jgi:hypothetical protein
MSLRMLLALALVAVAVLPVYAKKQKPPQQQQQVRGKAYGQQMAGKPKKVHGNNGLGNGVDPQPPGNPPVNDGPGRFPGNPGNKMHGKR